MEKKISQALDKIIDDKMTIMLDGTNGNKMINITADEEGPSKYTSGVIVPIVAEGDPIGSVILLSKETNVRMGDLERKLLKLQQVSRKTNGAE